jgi:outer membrane protein OmpA-like peptidoglycan-associated protein
VSVESTLKNVGDHVVVGPSSLSVEAGTLRLWIKSPKEANFHQYLPPAYGDLANASRELQVQQQIVGDVPIFFASTGWTLLALGKYEVQATTTVEVDHRVTTIASNPIRLEVLENPIDCELVARELTSDARRRHNYGMLMYLGRSDTSSVLVDDIFHFAQRWPHCSQSQGLDLAEVRSALHRYTTTAEKSALTSAADALSRVTSDQIPDAQYYTLQTNISHALEESGRSEEAKALRRRGRRVNSESSIQQPSYGGKVVAQFYFSSGSAVLPLDKVDELKEIGAYLTAMNFKLHIDGYADTVGKEKDNDASNIRVSVDRATAIAGYLVAGGVDASSMTVQGHGSSRSKPTKDTELQRLDRKADLSLD